MNSGIQITNHWTGASNAFATNLAYSSVCKVDVSQFFHWEICRFFNWGNLQRIINSTICFIVICVHGYIEMLLSNAFLIFGLNRLEFIYWIEDGDDAQLHIRLSSAASSRTNLVGSTATDMFLISFCISKISPFSIIKWLCNSSGAIRSRKFVTF